jgi:hypothetical protein
MPGVQRPIQIDDGVHKGADYYIGCFGLTKFSSRCKQDGYFETIEDRLEGGDVAWTDQGQRNGYRRLCVDVFGSHFPSSISSSVKQIYRSPFNAQRYTMDR